jgi:hypothetical protein
MRREVFAMTAQERADVQAVVDALERAIRRSPDPEIREFLLSDCRFWRAELSLAPVSDASAVRPRPSGPPALAVV